MPACVIFESNNRIEVVVEVVIHFFVRHAPPKEDV